MNVKACSWFRFIWWVSLCFFLPPSAPGAWWSSVRMLTTCWGGPATSTFTVLCLVRLLSWGNIRLWISVSVSLGWNFCCFWSIWGASYTAGAVPGPGHTSGDKSDKAPTLWELQSLWAGDALFRPSSKGQLQCCLLQEEFRDPSTWFPFFSNSSRVCTHL